MSFIHVNNHPHTKKLFVACCKMSNKHLIAGYHHDKQITSRVWILTCLPVYDEDDDDEPDMKLLDLYDSNVNQNSKEAKWDALIWNQSYESCSTTRSSWNKTILASQTQFQNMDNQRWKPLDTIHSKFPVAVPVGKGVIRCQFAESWNMLERFAI